MDMTVPNVFQSMYWYYIVVVVLVITFQSIHFCILCMKKGLRGKNPLNFAFGGSGGKPE